MARTRLREARVIEPPLHQVYMTSYKAFAGMAPTVGVAPTTSHARNPPGGVCPTKSDTAITLISTNRHLSVTPGDGFSTTPTKVASKKATNEVVEVHEHFFPHRHDDTANESHTL